VGNGKSSYGGHIAAEADFGVGDYWPFGVSHQLGGNDLVDSFGNWCQNLDSTGVFEAHILGDAVPLPGGTANTWNFIYPHADPSTSGGLTDRIFPSSGAQRITLELPRWVNARQVDSTLFDFEGPSNLQTLMIWRQTGGN